MLQYNFFQPEYKVFFEKKLCYTVFAQILISLTSVLTFSGLLAAGFFIIAANSGSGIQTGDFLPYNLK